MNNHTQTQQIGYYLISATSTPPESKSLLSRTPLSDGIHPHQDDPAQRSRHLSRQAFSAPLTFPGGPLVPYQWQLLVMLTIPHHTIAVLTIVAADYSFC